MSRESSIVGKIVRVDPTGLAFATASVGGNHAEQLYAFTFDKVSSYRGESASAIGLKKGAKVRLEAVDGRVTKVDLPPESEAAIGTEKPLA